MHSAPAVSYPVGRSFFQGGLIGGAVLVGAVSGILWWLQADSVDWRHGLMLASLLLCCVLAGLSWLRSPVGSLRWDGQTWCWSGEKVQANGYITMHLDAQSFLLLSLQPEVGPRIWLWPERRSVVSCWIDLRRAVFSCGNADQVAVTQSSAQSARR